MFEYLILMTRAILMEAVICGVIAGYTKMKGDKTERRIVWAFALAGTLFSIFIAYMRNTTSKIDSAILNGYVYAISLTAFVLFLVFTLKPFKNGKNPVIKRISVVLVFGFGS